MDGATIKTLFEAIVDDELADDTTAYQLMDVAKVQIEAERPWTTLQALDQTKTHTVGDTYLTSKALPSDFADTIKGGVFLGTNTTPLLKIPFSQRQRYKDSEGYYCIDLANGLYYLMGTASLTETINFNYIKTTTTMGSGVTWPFPVRFHPILAYKMAELFYPVDAGDKGRSWDDRWRVQYNDLWQRMITWDTQLQLEGIENSQKYWGSQNRDNVIDIDQ